MCTERGLLYCVTFKRQLVCTLEYSIAIQSLSSISFEACNNSSFYKRYIIIEYPVDNLYHNIIINLYNMNNINTDLVYFY